jgi:hypothetical protein
MLPVPFLRPAEARELIIAGIPLGSLALEVVRWDWLCWGKLWKDTAIGDGLEVAT